LQTRVGIATGLVVVGDLFGSGEAQERGIVGKTPNLAARLQWIAEPNTVVIAEATRGLVGNLFELRDLGARDLKGIDEPGRAWVALQASTVESRFEALHPRGLTAIVGREQKTELLLLRRSRAKSGEGQVVLISEEAGIGKSSRLIAALLESLIAEMLSLPNDGRYPALELTPQQRRQKTLEGAHRAIGGAVAAKACADGLGGCALNNKRMVVRGRNQSHKGRNRAEVAAVGLVAGGSIFRARAQRCAYAAGEVLGSARR
jgi:hypothetical protein